MGCIALLHLLKHGLQDKRESIQVSHRKALGLGMQEGGMLISLWPQSNFKRDRESFRSLPMCSEKRCKEYMCPFFFIEAGQEGKGKVEGTV